MTDGSHKGCSNTAVSQNGDMRSRFLSVSVVAVMRMTFVIMTVVVMLRLVTVTNVVIALVVTFLGLVSG